MPKKLVSKIMPSAQRLEHMRGWGFLGEKLFAHDLWHLNRKTVGYAFLNGIFWACMPIPFQMVGAAISALILRCNVPDLCGALLVNEPNHYAAVLRACLCFGRLGIELRAFISSRQRYSKLDTRATFIDLASFTYWLPFDRRLRRNTGLFGGSSYVVAMASELMIGRDAASRLDILEICHLTVM